MAGKARRVGHGWLLALVVVSALCAGVACSSGPSHYDRCGQVCDACGLGYCVGGGGGHCSSPGRAECIVAASGDCAAVTRCISGPDAVALCGAACGVCGLRDCVADDRSGPCADPARAACVRAVPDIRTPEDCDRIRACITDPMLDGGPRDAGALDTSAADDAAGR